MATPTNTKLIKINSIFEIPDKVDIVTDQVYEVEIEFKEDPNSSTNASPSEKIPFKWTFHFPDPLGTNTFISYYYEAADDTKLKEYIDALTKEKDALITQNKTLTDELARITKETQENLNEKIDIIKSNETNKKTQLDKINQSLNEILGDPSKNSTDVNATIQNIQATIEQQKTYSEKQINELAASLEYVKKTNQELMKSLKKCEHSVETAAKAKPVATNMVSDILKKTLNDAAAIKAKQAQDEADSQKAKEKAAAEAIEKEARENADAARLKEVEEARKKAEDELKVEDERKAAAEESAQKAKEAQEQELSKQKAKEEADLKAKEEADLKAKEEADLKATEEADLKATEEADLKAKEEADLKAQELAAKTTEEEARVKAQTDARLKSESAAEPISKPTAEPIAKQKSKLIQNGKPDIKSYTKPNQTRTKTIPPKNLTTEEMQIKGAKVAAKAPIIRLYQSIGGYKEDNDGTKEKFDNIYKEKLGDDTIINIFKKIDQVDGSDYNDVKTKLDQITKQLILILQDIQREKDKNKLQNKPKKKGGKVTRRNKSKPRNKTFRNYSS
jgi:hypothetical protein